IVGPRLDPEEGRLQGPLPGLEVLRDVLEPLPLLLDLLGGLRRTLLRDREGLPLRRELDLPPADRLLPGPHGVEALPDLLRGGRVRGGPRRGEVLLPLAEGFLPPLDLLSGREDPL